MLVIYGYGAAGRNTAVNRRTSNNAWLQWVGLLAPPLFLAWMWLSMRRMPMFTFYVIVLIATSVITWWRRRTISSPKPVQLRLVGAGFAQRLASPKRVSRTERRLMMAGGAMGARVPGLGCDLAVGGGDPEGQPRGGAQDLAVEAAGHELPVERQVERLAPAGEVLLQLGPDRVRVRHDHT